MPILPPRNLPLSPPGKAARPSSPASPSQSSNARHASTPQRKASGLNPANNRSQTAQTPSATPSRARSQAGAPFDREAAGTSLTAADQSISSIHSSHGQLERHEETTYHRRLRTLLWDHRAAREAWDEVVSSQGARSIAALSRCAQTLDELMASSTTGTKATAAGKLTSDDLPVTLQISSTEAQARKEEATVRALTTWQREQEAMQTFLQRLDKCTHRLHTLSDAAETLMIEATRAKGDVFVFEQEAWTTWPMERFLATIQSTTSRYSLQADQLHRLVDILCRRGCVLGREEKESEEGGAVQRVNRRKDEEDEEVEDEEEGDRTTTPDDRKHKERARIRQRVLEEWQALPLLRDDDHHDPFWFEDVCEAEVGRWDER